MFFLTSLSSFVLQPQNLMPSSLVNTWPYQQTLFAIANWSMVSLKPNMNIKPVDLFLSFSCTLHIALTMDLWSHAVIYAPMYQLFTSSIFHVQLYHFWGSSSGICGNSTSEGVWIHLIQMASWLSSCKPNDWISLDSPHPSGKLIV